MSDNYELSKAARDGIDWEKVSRILQCRRGMEDIVIMGRNGILIASKHGELVFYQAQKLSPLSQAPS